jgi:hypothetical protein
MCTAVCPKCKQTCILGLHGQTGHACVDGHNW